MHILFLDESGTPPNSANHPDKYFVIGGIVIPDSVWHRVYDTFHGMKVRRGLIGELKWRYFAAHNDDRANPMREMSQVQRDEIRREIYGMICSIKSIKAMACVGCVEAAYEIPSISCSDDLYHFCYKPISERFQYYLQDLSRTVGRMETGIVVADHRGHSADARLRHAHERLVRSDTGFTSTYKNLVESLFFLPSELSIGIQLADMVAGAIWRRYEKRDARFYNLIEPALRKSPAGNVEGYGIIKFPKGTWR